MRNHARQLSYVRRVISYVRIKKPTRNSRLRNWAVCGSPMGASYTRGPEGEPDARAEKPRKHSSPGRCRPGSGFDIADAALALAALDNSDIAPERLETYRHHLDELAYDLAELCEDDTSLQGRHAALSQPCMTGMAMTAIWRLTTTSPTRISCR